MSKEIIRFKGLSLNRDEQSADKGELSVCAGVELHDGALRPSVLEGSMVQHDVSGTMTDSVLKVKVSDTDHITKLLYVHETASYRHFIGVYDKKLYWFQDDGTVGSPLVDTSHTPIHAFDSGDAIVSVNSIGNTLIVLAKTGVHYILWKDSDYNYLGQQFPFVDIKFRPDGGHLAEYEYKDTMPDATLTGDKRVAFRLVEVNSGDIYETDDTIIDGSAATPDQRSRVRIKDEHQTLMTEAVQALINQTNNKVANEGHFYAPFLIRYCYRLYDGSMVMHSAPLLMNISHPDTSRVYACNLVTWATGAHTSGYYGPVGAFGIFGNFDVHDEWQNDHPGEEGYAFQCRKTLLAYMPSNVGIEYSVPPLPNNLSDWSDIISSVDIFISRQFPKEDFTEKVKRCVKAESLTSVLGVRQAALDSLTMKTDYDEQHKTIWYDSNDVNGSAPYNINVVFDVKTTDDTEYLNMLRDTSNFFKLKSIDLNDLATTSGFVALQYDKYLIPIISTQEQMKDDYHSHYQLLPGDKDYGCYVYNHRLSLYGFNEKLFEGFGFGGMVNIATDNNPTITITDIYVELKTEDGTKYVRHSEGVGGVVTAQYLLCNSMLFYPDSRAVKMYLKTSNYNYVIFNMKPHNFLNGAISTDYFYQTSVTPQTYAGTFRSNDIVLLQSKVLTSEVDDPYYFPLEGRNTVGIGAIVGLAAVTRALSQGQVGDHDLIAFCTDGIWVMKVSGEGTYSAVHNISREVCTNPKSICQLDQSVAFATERSLSRFVESNVVSMSDELDGPAHNWSNLFGTFFNNTLLDCSSIILQLGFTTSAVEMFNGGSVFYDYAGSRVVVLPEDTSAASVALVFSIRDQAWSTMAIPAIKAVVPGYPSPFVQLGDGKVMILDKPYNYRSTGANVPGLILTRELTFSDTMDVIRGYQHYADCAAAPMLWLFGSNDQRNWVALGNSNRWYNNYLPGRSFRFFRIAIYTQMKPSEEYQQLLLEIVNKYGKL